MISYDHKIRVRYSEVDQMGFVYHAHYVTYLDEARTEMLRSLGLSNYEIEQQGIMIPVIGVEIKYISAAHYDDLLTIRVLLKEKPRVTMRFDYEILRESGEVITRASVKLAFMDSTTKRACRPPKNLTELIDKVEF